MIPKVVMAVRLSPPRDSQMLLSKSASQRVALVPSSNCVQVLVNILRYRLDLGVEFIFNLEESRFVIFSDQIDG